jgi:hypothetical protein
LKSTYDLHMAYFLDDYVTLSCLDWTVTRA